MVGSANNEAELTEAETGVSTCPHLELCDAACASDLRLSQIGPGDPRRGSRNAKVILVTEAPDSSSGTGSAYSGTSADRLINYFTEPTYGINLDAPTTDGPQFATFLKENSMYATSAVKCVVDGPSHGIDYDAVRRCRGCFLDGQIEAHEDARILVPMGKIASASVIRRLPDSFELTQILGKGGKGIWKSDPRYGMKTVVLPHPSGSNPLSNPPTPDSQDAARTARQKHAFRQALSALREFLTEEGYTVGSAYRHVSVAPHTPHPHNHPSEPPSSPI